MNRFVYGGKGSRHHTPNDLLINYLAMFEKKIRSHTMTKEDINVLQYLLKLIFIRQEQIDKEEKAKPVFYWYSRQGRNLIEKMA